MNIAAGLRHGGSMTCGRLAESGQIAADDLARRREFEDWPEPQRKRHLPRLWLSDPSGRALLKVVNPADALIALPGVTVSDSQGFGHSHKVRHALCLQLEHHLMAVNLDGDFAQADLCGNLFVQ